MSLKDKIDTEKLPQHIAIIMDGNGRWAKKRGKYRIFGHEKGVVPVRECSEAAAELGIKYLTLYAFSTENWKRPSDEVNALMALLVTTISKEINTLNENNIKLETIGDLEKLPEETYNKLLDAKKQTANNSRMTLVVALSYSSKWEITNTVKEIAVKVKNNELEISDINQDLISNMLETKGIPDPELLIRTSGELRISNFLLWQIAYTELYFTEKLWPDFRKDDLYTAILDYQCRERRFGKISEQCK
jgi:undecaprenyl diphosphate synthase